YRLPFPHTMFAKPSKHDRELTIHRRTKLLRGNRLVRQELHPVKCAYGKDEACKRVDVEISRQEFLLLKVADQPLVMPMYQSVKTQMDPMRIAPWLLVKRTKNHAPAFSAQQPRTLHDEKILIGADGSQRI